MELSKNKTALAISVAVAGIVTTAALAMAVWPALTRPDPPLEKTGDDGLHIRLVEPPRAAAKSSSLLDVGLSEAAEAMAKGREALFVRTPAVRPPPVKARRPVQVAQLDQEDEADLPPPPEPVDDRWEREAWRRDRFEEAQRRREEERLAREDRAERAAWEREERDRRRWEEAREQDRYEDRYAPPPEPDPEPSARW